MHIQEGVPETGYSTRYSYVFHVRVGVSMKN